MKGREKTEYDILLELSSTIDIAFLIGMYSQVPNKCVEKRSKNINAYILLNLKIFRNILNNFGDQS